MNSRVNCLPAPHCATVVVLVAITVSEVFLSVAVITISSLSTSVTVPVTVIVLWPATFRWPTPSRLLGAISNILLYKDPSFLVLPLLP